MIRRVRRFVRLAYAPAVGVVWLGLALTHRSIHAWLETFGAASAVLASVEAGSRKADESEDDHILADAPDPGPRWASGTLRLLFRAALLTGAVVLLIYATGPFTHDRHGPWFIALIALGISLFGLNAVDTVIKIRLRRQGRWPEDATRTPYLAARAGYLVGAAVRGLARAVTPGLAATARALGTVMLHIPFPRRQLRAAQARLSAFRSSIPLPRSRPDEAYLATLWRARRNAPSRR